MIFRKWPPRCLVRKNRELNRENCETTFNTMESLKPVNYCFVFLQERHGLPNPPSSQTLAVNKTISQTYSYSYSMNSSLSHAAPPILMPLIVFQWINHNWKTIVFLLFASLISEQHSFLYAVFATFAAFHAVLLVVAKIVEVLF